VLTVLAIGNAWFHPFEQPDSDVPAASLSSSPIDRMARRTPGWTRFADATVTPGIQTITGRAQCTTNFVFTDAAKNVYLGQAAHCATLSEQQSAGCLAKSRPIGTRVTFALHSTQFASGTPLAKGRLAYSSWQTMQRMGEKDPNACRFNDFALVKLDPGDRHKVNPSLPFWGGPTGISASRLDTLDQVFGFGRSSLRADGSTASRQAAQAIADRAEFGGWTHSIIAKSPGIPGDSGSAYVDADGRAIGTLSTLAISRLLVNRLGDLREELAYARRNSGIRGLKLELGTAPFNRVRAADALR
jgi:hypothetical protein